MQAANLLRRCASALADGRLSADESALVRTWGKGIEQGTAAVAERFHSAPISDWDWLISEHAAHRH